MIDDKSIELFRQFLESLGLDTSSNGLRDTPRRVVKAYKELLTVPDFTPTVFDNDGDYKSLVILRDIPYYTLCEHHMLPFFGHAHVAYLPNGKIVGLSKLGRWVQQKARSLQVQERMTTQIADAIEETLHPEAVGVVVDGRHMCMEMRGLSQQGIVTRTTVLRGGLLTNASLKEEFILGIPSV